MIPFIIGCAVGGIFGVIIMCLFQINKSTREE